MADLPSSPITTIPAESPGDVEWPTLGQITVADLVGPSAANRQPTQLETRSATTRDRINLIIADLNFIETGGPGSLNAFLPRDGGQAMAAALDMGTNQITNVVDPSLATDAATKNYVDSNTSAGAAGYIGEIKWVRGSVPATQIDVEFCRVLDNSGVKVLAPANNSTIDATTTGAGGLDTGSRTASTWYYIWAIGDSNLANPDDVILSLSPGPPFGAGAAGTPSGASPSYPSGYDIGRRIGAIRTDGSNNFLSARKIHGVTWYEDQTRSQVYGPAGGPGGTFTTLSCAAYCPPTAERVILWAQGQRSGGATGVQIYWRSGAASPAGGQTLQMEMSNNGETHMDNHLMLEVDSSQNVQWRHAGPLGGNVIVRVLGFVEDMKHSV